MDLNILHDFQLRTRESIDEIKEILSNLTEKNYQELNIISVHQTDELIFIKIREVRESIRNKSSSPKRQARKVANEIQTIFSLLRNYDVKRELHYLHKVWLDTISDYLTPSLQRLANLCTFQEDSRKSLCLAITIDRLLTNLVEWFCRYNLLLQLSLQQIQSADHWYLSTVLPQEAHTTEE